MTGPLPHGCFESSVGMIISWYKPLLSQLTQPYNVEGVCGMRWGLQSRRTTCTDTHGWVIVYSSRSALKTCMLHNRLLTAAGRPAVRQALSGPPLSAEHMQACKYKSSYLQICCTVTTGPGEYAISMHPYNQSLHVDCLCSMPAQTVLSD